MEVLTLYYREFSLTFAQISLLVAATMISQLIFEVPSGAFADLYGRKKSLYVTVAAFFIVLIILAFLPGFFSFIIASIFVGISMAFASGAWESIGYDSLKMIGREKEYVKLMSRTEAIFLAVAIISAYLSPLLYSINIKYPLYVSAAAIIFLGMSVALLFEPKRNNKFDLKSHYIQMKDGFRFSLNHSKILWLISFGILGHLAWRVYGEIINAPYIIDLGFSLQEFAIIGLVSRGIHSTIFFGDKLEQRLNENNSLILSIFGMIAGLFGIVLVKNFIAILIGIFWFFVSFKNIIVMNFMQAHLNEKNRATIISILAMTSSLIGAILIPMFGILIDSTSLAWGIITLAIFIFAVGTILIFVKINKRIWKSLS